MTLPVTITGISTATAPVGPFKVAAGDYSGTGIATGVTITATTTLTGTGSAVSIGQSLTNGASSLTIPSVVLLSLSKNGSPSDNVYCEITATDPSGTVLATSNQVASSSLSGGAGANQTFTFPSPPTISASASFGVTLRRTGVDATNTILAATGGSYAGGSNWTYNGTTWTAGATDWALIVNKTVTIATDAYYFFGRDGTTATTLQAYKSTAPDTSWSSVTTKAGFTTAILNIAGARPFAGDTVVAAITITGTASAIFFAGTGSTTRLAQTFTNGASEITIPSIVVPFNTHTGTPTGNVYAEITATDYAGAVLATSNQVAVSGVASTNVTFTFASPPTIAASATFAVVLRRTVGDAVNAPRPSGSPGGTSTYAGGALFVYNGSTWSDNLNDLLITINAATTIAESPVIHLVVQDGTMSSSVATKYLSFDAATDTFLASTETVLAASAITGQSTSGWNASLVVRSTGEAVVFYNSTQTNTSGTARARLGYKRRTGVNTFSAAVQVDPNTATESTAPIAVLGASDRVHLLFFNGTNTMQRHLTSANVLGTAASTGATTAVQDACAYNDAGTIRHVGFTAAQSIRWASADNPTVTAATVTFGTPVRVIDDSADVYALYQNSGDSDLYVKKSTDDGATFDGGTSAFTGTVTAAAASVSKNQTVYQRGNFVFPYLVNDGGSTWKYNETTVRSVSTNKTLDATVGASYAVTGAATTTVLLKRKIDATTGSGYALVGTDVAVTKGVPPKVLTADGGSYLLTGAVTTTVLRRARIDATTGSSYAVTGSVTTNVLLKRKIDAATTPGAYALTGTAASLLHKYRQDALAGSYALTGTDAAVTKTTPLVNKTLPADGGSYALTGTDVAIIKRVFKRLTADGSSYALTGNATAVLLHRWKPAALGGTYALTGSDATLTKFANKRITADSSSYAITGAATTAVLHKWKMVATTPASYALAGNSATFLIHKDIVSAAPGAYALTGFDVAFQIRTDKFLSAALGTYILTGTAVSLRKTWKHAAAAGSYAITGTDAAITRRVPKTVVAASGSYVLSGTPASVLHRWKHAAAGGAYAITGTDARPWHGYKVIAGASSYAVTGTTATINKVAARAVTAAPGSYALTGTAASVLHRGKLVASSSSYAITGTAALVRYGYRVAIGSSSYALTGTAALFPRKRVFTADPLIGRYQVTGGLLTRLLYNWRFPLAGSSYAITGTPAILRRVRTITALPGAYALAGSPAIINRIGMWSVVADPASYEITGNVARIFGGEWTISNRTVVVAAEDRTALAIGESRTVHAIAETRLVTVAADVRTVLAIAENRTIQSAGEEHGVSEMVQQRSQRNPGLQHRLVTTAEFA